MADVRYHRVSPKFWSDPTVLGWDDDTRLLALYLLTCEHRTTEGLFRLPKQYILADLEWSAERLTEPFARLVADGFIDYDDDAKVLLIVKALAYQAPSNPNGVKAALKALSTLPPNRLYSRFYDLAAEHSERLAKALPEPLPQPLGDPPALAPAPSSSSTDGAADAPHDWPRVNGDTPLTDRIVAWAKSHGHVRQVESQADVTRWCLDLAADHLGDSPRFTGAAVQLVVEWVERMCGEPLATAATKHLVRLLNAEGPRLTFTAMETAVTSGAGLSEDYADDPQALVRYARSCIARWRAEGSGRIA